MYQDKKTIQELNLMDDFLMTESMLHEETAQRVARLIIERATQLKVGNLVIDCQKTMNGMNTYLHGIRLDVAVNEFHVTEEKKADTIRLFDIEPNNRQESALPKRNRYYQALTDVKLLETGIEYHKLPELWTIWILPYDPFAQNYMLYSVKNVVEGFEEIDYNDGVRTLFLYTDGEYGGSPELKRLLTYIKHSTAENAADEELKTLHAMIEQIKGNSEIGVKYMHVREMMADTIKDAIDKGMKQGIEQGMKQGIEQGIEQGREVGIQALIETCKDMGLSKRDTQQYVETKFSMSQNTAGKFMTKYWK